MAARAACDEHAACWSPRAGLSMRTATRTAATTHRTKEVPGPLLTEEHGKASAASRILQANTNGVPVRGSVNCISVTQTFCRRRDPRSRTLSLISPVAVPRDTHYCIYFRLILCLRGYAAVLGRVKMPDVLIPDRGRAAAGAGAGVNSYVRK